MMNMLTFIREYLENLRFGYFLYFSFFSPRENTSVSPFALEIGFDAKSYTLDTVLEDKSEADPSSQSTSKR